MALRDLSVKQVADLAGLSPQAVYNFLSNERWPGPDNLMRISRAVRCSPADLLKEPEAIERPDVPTAWRIIKDFMDSMTPMKHRFLEEIEGIEDGKIAEAIELLTLFSQIPHGEAEHVLETLRTRVGRIQGVKKLPKKA